MVAAANFDICILVVLYGCSTRESATICSLVENGSDFIGLNVKVVIWNNGPRRLDDVDMLVPSLEVATRTITVDYFQDISNVPLAKLYNKVIASVKANRYCIFDHDTRFSKNYINILKSSSNYDLNLPKVISHSRVRGPIYNGEIISSARQIKMSRRNRVLAIGSGIVISEALIDAMVKANNTVFDERYALYGVDTTFCLRLSALSGIENFIIFISGEIFHSLSRLEKENKATLAFRARERGLDLGITLRNYFSFYWLFKSFIKISKSVLMNEAFSIKSFIEGLLRGKHPRAFK